MPITQEEIDAMTSEEKVSLINRIMETLGNDEYVDNEPEETEDELKLLMERWQDYKANPSNAIPGEVAFERLRNRKNGLSS